MYCLFPTKNVITVILCLKNVVTIAYRNIYYYKKYAIIIKMQRIKMWERRMRKIEWLNGWVNEWKKEKENSVRGGSRNARVGCVISRRDILIFVCDSHFIRNINLKWWKSQKSIREFRRENADPASLRYKSIITKNTNAYKLTWFSKIDIILYISAKLFLMLTQEMFSFNLYLDTTLLL